MFDRASLEDSLVDLLSHTYALYLKTQNYHWNVEGPNFYSLHELFEDQYTELATAVDDIAERVRILGKKVLVTFNSLAAHNTLSDATVDISPSKMCQDLASDHKKILELLESYIKISNKNNDEGTTDFLVGRLRYHEKAHWMLSSCA